MDITLGILGGGQLGRMSALAAKTLDIKTVIFTPEENSSAAQVASGTIVGPYNDRDALKKFSDCVDVISYEFENIPLETILILEKEKPVYPRKNLLEVTQDRIKEKQFLNDCGVPTTSWVKVTDSSDIQSAFKKWHEETCILKTTRFGYDGKGQRKVSKDDDLPSAIQALGSTPLIAEQIVDFKCEISVVVTRDKNGRTITYEPSLNIHRDFILNRSIVPSGLPDSLLQGARDIAFKIATAFDLQGVLAVEMFVTKDNNLLANEIAPRTHNSGHWTVDACAASQFENHVRAVCGLPVLSSERHSNAEMINLIGNDILNLSPYENRENTFVHVYGKGEARPGRKMGHVTILNP